MKKEDTYLKICTLSLVCRGNLPMCSGPCELLKIIFYDCHKEGFTQHSTTQSLPPAAITTNHTRPHLQSTPCQNNDASFVSGAPSGW